jgi:hypothetical protein
LSNRPHVQLTGLSRLRSVAWRAGAWLALLALAVQIVVSFGHVHARDFTGDVNSRTADGWHNIVAKKAAASNPASLADDEDQCPICFSASLLARSFVPLAGQALAAITFGVVSYASASAAFRLPGSGRAPFRSRAPPSA